MLEIAENYGLTSPEFKEASLTHSDRLYCIFLGIVKDGVLTIGNVSAPVYNPSEKIKVPDVLFYDNPQVMTHTHWTRYT